MSVLNQQDHSATPTLEPTSLDMKKNGYGILHSFPFIDDRPNDRHQQKKRTKLNHHAPFEKPAIATTSQIKVPPGVIHIKPTWKPVTLNEKPPFSYATMIAHAILSSQERKLTLNEIYQWISEQYPCYSIKDHRWQNSIRHNLSLQKAFVKLDRDSDTPTGGKGCYWTILPGYEQQFIDNLMKHDKTITTTTNQKLVQQKTNKKKPAHLFTIFRMTTKENHEETKKSHRKSAPKRKVSRDDSLDDSDCDSGVDIDIQPTYKTATDLPLLQQQQQQQQQGYMWPPDDMMPAQDLMMLNPYIDHSLYLLPDNNTSQPDYQQALLDTQTTSTVSFTNSSSYYCDSIIPFYNGNDTTIPSTPNPTYTNHCPTANSFNPMFSTTQPLYPASAMSPTTPIPSFDSLSQQDLFYPF